MIEEIKKQVELAQIKSEGEVSYPFSVYKNQLASYMEEYVIVMETLLETQGWARSKMNYIRGWKDALNLPAHVMGVDSYARALKKQGERKG